MAYNYVERFGLDYDQALVQGLLTAPLETPEVDWLNAKTFRERGVTTSGLQEHGRGKGYNYGTVQQEEALYTLGHDRDVEFFVDVMDVDETGQQLAAARVTSAFLREQAIPETDAYRFSKMSQYANDNGLLVTETVTPETALDVVTRMTDPLRRYGSTNVLNYVSSSMMSMIANSPDITRMMTVNQAGIVEGTNITTRIASYNGMSFIEVYDIDRFYTQFDYTDGFKPVTGASQPINMLSVARPGIIAKVKHNSVYLFAPGEHTQGDGWLYQYRIYHDLFQRANRTDTIAVSAGAVVA